MMKADEPQLRIFNQLLAIGYWLSAIFLLAGCATAEDPTRRDLATAERMSQELNVPAPLKPFYQRLYWEGESQATLNRMRLASAAMERGYWTEAQRALDEVIPAIEALGPADERSREAMSAFEAEEIKRFKGEPYERAMVYFLRGLLYLRENDWSNARACFKSTSLQGNAANATQPMWAGALWLEGWCDERLGQHDDATDCWKRSRALKAGKSMPVPTAGDRTLVVALLGFGPTKTAQGKYGDLLDYHPGDSRAERLRLRKDPTPVEIPIAENLLANAKARGKRQMDVVNEDKADTREGTETAGDALTLGGLGTTIGGAAAGDSTVALAGLGATAAGLITKGVGSSIQPQSDTRTWDLLPATIHILPIPPGNTTSPLTFEFLTQTGAPLRAETVDQPNPAEPRLILLIER